MRDQSTAKANAAIWSAYLATEWDGWFGLSRVQSTRAAERTGTVIATALAPWLAFLTAHRPKN